jgi:hypothetical protein
MDQNQKITHLLGNQIPDYVQDYYPMFVIFMTKYFEFLENTSTGVQYQLQNLQLNRDIDTTADQLALQFLNTYAPNLPDNSVIDRSVLVKNFRDFYALKGSEKSLKFFFRAFYGDDIEIEYPRNYMFATSDGNWYKETSVRVQSNIGNPVNLEHTRVYGSSSGAYATVNRVVQVTGVGLQTYYDLVLQPYSWVGSFTSGEAIVGTYVNFANNSSSQVLTTSVSGILTADGRYLDSHSQLSNDQRLQDSLYYQQFSYVIRTNTDRETWADHVLKYLHPSGTVLFNDYITNSVGINTAASSFAQTLQTETTVKFPVIKSYLTSPTYTFDRTADFQTGTSNTTSIGLISYTASFDYPGENVTWALQRDGDVVLYGGGITEIIRPTGATFDKLQRAIGTDTTYTIWNIDTNSSLVVTRYVSGSSNLTAGTLLTSFTTTALARDVSSMVLVLTWMKNTAGNNPAGESANAVVISFSSNATIIPKFDNELQRNFADVSLGRSLEYRNLVYTHSSNSISANITSGLPLSSTTTDAQIVFKPFNWERGTSYDRVAIKFTIDQSLQLNTSLTETFNTANITATGLIASWSSLTTSASVGFFGTNSSAVYTFSSNCFVFNGAGGDVRFLQTRNFPDTQQLDLTVSYMVGDGYNGGDVPEIGEDLDLQYSINGGAGWFSAGRLWTAGDIWTYGQQTVAGSVLGIPGSTFVTGVNTLFSTEFRAGDRFTINSSTTTAYTVVSVFNNNVMQITPALVDDFRNPVLQAITASTTSGNAEITASGAGWVSYSIGSSFTFGNSSLATTAYTTYLLTEFNKTLVAPVPVNTTSGAQVFQLTGVPMYKKLPTAQQFATTSITVYGPAGSVTAAVRIIQLGTGGLGVDQDVYAVENLTVNSFRFQSTTGNISIGVAVSSNSTLNISDTDFFNVTTIGIT